MQYRIATSAAKCKQPTSHILRQLYRSTISGAGTFLRAIIILIMFMPAVAGMSVNANSGSMKEGAGMALAATAIAGLIVLANLSVEHDNVGNIDDDDDDDGDEDVEDMYTDFNDGNDYPGLITLRGGNIDEDSDSGNSNDSTSRHDGTSIDLDPEAVMAEYVAQMNEEEQQQEAEERRRQNTPQ